MDYLYLCLLCIQCWEEKHQQGPPEPFGIFLLIDKHGMHVKWFMEKNSLGKGRIIFPQEGRKEGKYLGMYSCHHEMTQSPCASSLLAPIYLSSVHRFLARIS